MSRKSIQQLGALLGKSMLDEDLLELVHSIPTANIEDHPEFTLINSFDEGFWLFYEKPHEAVTEICCFLIGDAVFAPFRGMLPNGLMLEDTRETVQQKLGQPHRSGTCHKLKLPPEEGFDEIRVYDSGVPTAATVAWDIFECDQLELEFNFDLERDGTLAQISLRERSADV